MSNDAIISISLNEVANISAGHPLRGSAEALEAGEVALIQLKNVDPDSGIDWGSVSGVELPSGRRPRWLTSSDVIFASRGARNYAYPIVEGPPQCVCSPHFFVLTIKDAQVLHPEFLAWQINQKPAQDYLRKSAVGTQAILTIRRPAMEALPLFIPPMREQQLIVNFWRAAQSEHTALTQLIENNKRLSSAIAHGLHNKAKEAHS